ncbi:MAG TPA: hypothetical protein VGR31_11405 [Planctomycetota bacterium]|jgi:hypothetical protein|nr:hypothetical protein [Planctomycetota bacterium]
MNSLALYVRKEWRDQRMGLLGLLVALPLLFAIVCVAGDGTAALEEFLRPGIAAACGALVVFFGVGTDLIPREVRGTRVGFLARLPAGLARAFAAKVVFFAAATLAVAAYAAGIALAASLARSGTLPEAFLGAIEERSVLLAIGLALWIVAASTWVQHGALALPTAAAVAALLCSPAWLFFGPHSILEPTLAELRAFAALCALGSCASAGAAFVFGRRFGANQSSRSVLAGAVVAVVSLAPAWLWSAHRLYAAHHCDLGDPRFTIEDVRIDADGTRAAVDGVLGSARETFTVDLHGTAAALPQTGQNVPRASKPVDLSPLDRLGPMVPDGRFLLAWGGDVFLYDPGTSERARLAVAGGETIRADFVFAASGSSPMRALDLPLVVVSGDFRACLARLDLERHELIPARGSQGSTLRLVGLGSDESAIVVEDNRRLVRVRCGSDERDVLLPAAP